MTALQQYQFYDGQEVPIIRGSGGGGGCFIAGTKILMSDGTEKVIEDIQVGDLVTAFDKSGNLGPASVIHLYRHKDDEFINIKHWAGELTVTPNHWILMEDGLFLEAGKFTEKDQIVTYEGKISPIESIKSAGKGNSYNFTVSQQHTYIANNVRVHNGGGGKGGGGSAMGAVEDPNDKFSTDIVFISSGLGEGPVYRINPNGPQDIEIQDGNIDDLINLDGDGLENTTLFKTLTNPGSTNQPPLRVFGQEIATPQNFTSTVPLKKGNVGGIPESKVELQSTSNQSWDALRFNFELRGLINQDDKGNIHGYEVSLSIQVFNNTGTTQIVDTIEKTIKGKTNTKFKFDVGVLIPEDKKSDQGYKFTIKKTSDDSDSSKIHDNIFVSGWTEIEFSQQAYPRTAHIGYAIRAHSEHVSGVPTFTSLVKGLLVKVPSNYNQPILENGDIDWRELEVVDGSGGTTNAYQNEGYSLLFSGPDTKLTTDNPQIYVGTWDGRFVYGWSQNPVWIIYDLLTNSTYGLGIPEDVIDKFKFYQVAMYCDACNTTTGAYEGVTALADGTFRHKPRGKYTAIRENQFGLPDTTQIVERRFICDVTIHDQGQAMDVINQITTIFRGALVYNMGKLTLAVDLPNELPVAMFNEANIKDGSLQISGIKESDIFSAVDVSYVEPTNHYKRETVRIDTVDRNDGIDRSAIENTATLDLLGVTRRSQALRYAHYQIAASRYLRRQIQFTTSIEAISLAPGDVISISQKMNGLGFGFGGKIASDSNASSDAYDKAQAYLEYFTEPSLSSDFFTSNTAPAKLAMRIYKQNSDTPNLYLIDKDDYDLITTTSQVQATSNTWITSNANVETGIDRANVKVTAVYNAATQKFDALSNWTTDNSAANVYPQKGDLWMLGEMLNPGTTSSGSADIYTNKAGKLFKVTSLNRTDEQEVEISGIEYISNVYVDSDTFIDYTPTGYTDIPSSFLPPPTPEFSVKVIPQSFADGSTTLSATIDTYTSRYAYGPAVHTEYLIMQPTVTQLVTNLESVVNTLPPTFKFGNTTGLATEKLSSAILTGKNGFSGSTGELKLLCNAITTSGGGGDEFIEFRTEGLNVAFDFNFMQNILQVNDAELWSSLKGNDYIGFPVNEKANEGAKYGFVGHNPRITQYSSNIEAYNTGAGASQPEFSSIAQDTIVIKNSSSTDGTKLFSSIPTPPFYITLNQLLDSRYYNNNSFYVSGTSYTYSKSNTVSLIAPVSDSTAEATSHIQPLEIVPKHKGFIKAYVDGAEISAGSFNLHTNNYPANVEFLELDSEASKVRVVIDHYTVPTIEVGDNIQFLTGNVYSVEKTSYDTNQSTHWLADNTAMTQNNIYTITLARVPLANVSGVTFTNISPDILGSVGNVSGNTFTLDYNTFTYPGKYNLTNNHIYHLSFGGEWEKAPIDSQNRLLRNLEVGPFLLKSRNRNAARRTSPWITKLIMIDQIPISKVSDLSIEEGLFIDRNKGVSVRATISFNHINGEEVTDYEISYKLTGETTELTTFNTIKVAAAGVDSDGKVRFTVNNVDRGSESGVNSIVVRVTALNKEIRGITAEKTATILGKTASPKNIFNLSAGQSSDQITLFWQFSDPIDLDLQDVVIRRLSGETTASIANFNLASSLVTVAAGVNRKSVPIDTFGEYTYLARTKDTSGNFSEDVIAFTFTTVQPTTDQIVRAYNEDSPSTNFTDITNTNASEANYPSFNTANADGLVYANKGDGYPSSLVDNANGHSSGFSAGSSATDLLVTGAEAEYHTQVRDMGQADFYRISLDYLGSQSIKSTYKDFKTEIFRDVSEASSGGTSIIKASGIGTTVGTTWDTLYDSNNKTLVDYGDYTNANVTNGQNVLAVWNVGKYSGNVISLISITQASIATANTSVSINSNEHGLTNGTRFIIHDVEGMTQINNKELYAKRVNNTSIQIYQNSGLTTALDTSSGYSAYSGSGVIDQGDYANTNAYALIAGVDGSDKIVLGGSYYANGTVTGSNAFANITADAGNTFAIVDMRDYTDSTDFTFDGGGDSVKWEDLSQVRLSSSDNVFTWNTILGSNGNVNNETFVAYTINDGWQAFEAGEKQFRWMQLKFRITNSNPDENDFTLDKIRYKISKQKKEFDVKNQNYSSAPLTIDWSGKNFTEVPLATVSTTNTTIALTAVWTALSKTAGTVKLYKADGTAASAGTHTQVNVRAEGV